jgi:hypothetical protein
MNKRQKDYIRGRSSVLDNDQVADRKRNRPFRKIIPLLVFAFIALMIARQEIPAVGSAWERVVAPDVWLARQNCQKAALENVKRREFSRILKPGKVNRTTDGLYIERLVIGAMGESGNEVANEYSCYLDSNGTLVRLNQVTEASDQL